MWMLIVHISLNYGYIVYGTPLPRLSIFSWMSFFMVPFFFFSGFCFKEGVPFMVFLKKKTLTLIVPYIFYTLVGGGIYLVYSYIHNGCFDSKVLNIPISGMPFYNTPMWFFVTLFSVNIAYYLLRKLPNIIVHVTILLCFIVAWQIEGANSHHILMHRAFPLALVYFHLGNQLNRYQKLINVRVFIFCIVGYVIINVLNQQCLWFVDNNQVQGNYLLNLMFSVFATVGLWYIFRTWIPNNNWLTSSLNHLGRYSLIVFATHRPILNYVYEPIIRGLWPNVNYYAFLIIGIFILIVVSIALYKLIIRLQPKLVGM